MKYVVTLNGKDYEVEVDELSEAIVTSVAPTAASAPAAPVLHSPRHLLLPHLLLFQEAEQLLRLPCPEQYLK